MKRSLLLALGAYAVLHWLGRNAGATQSERSLRLPGDEIVDDPQLQTTHAITIAATPDDVWPWLVQMGWHRGGWYTARWVDQLLFPANEPSADHIIPELQGLTVGDFIPDGAPETGVGFAVVDIEQNRHLVLHSTTHLPPGFRERFGARIDWSWSFVLQAMDERTTRFVFRSRAQLSPTWLSLVYWLTIIPADFVMSRQMMRGLRRRAEWHLVRANASQVNGGRV